MLVEFRVSNFRSFKEQQIFSMVASSDRTLESNTITSETLGKLRLNRSAAVYGANASGKSNLVAALSFVRDFVVNVYTRRPAVIRERSDETSIPVIPFLLDPVTKDAPSTFEIVFIQKGVRYQYGFEVDPVQVQAEWLIAFPHGQPQRWYERRLRTDGTYDYEFRSKAFRGEKQVITEVTRPDVLYLSTGATFASEQLGEVYKWFEGLRFLYPNNRNRLIGNNTARRASQDLSFHKRVRDLLVFADVGIVDFTVEEVGDPIIQRALFPEDDNVRARRALRYDTAFVHQNSPEHEAVALPLAQESRGTQQLFELARLWIEVLEQGQVLIADELGTSLHPLLTRKLVEMLNDPQLNRHGAQLIFNTHDVTLLDRALFRRDQIWFTEKDRDGATHLYPLLDFSPRKDEALEKGYLQGRYGAIPFIERLEDWLASDDKEDSIEASADA